jgi:hypothetical protein
MSSKKDLPLPQTDVILVVSKPEMSIWRKAEARSDICHAGRLSNIYTI